MTLSRLLYRLGRLSARRPWTVIGSWLVVSVLVIGASGAAGRELEDTFEVPGVDSQRAAALLSAAGSDRAGLTAQVVMTPREPGVTFSRPAARIALDRVREAAAALPGVRRASEPAEVSADGRVAVVRLQYRVLEELTVDDLERLKAFGRRAGDGSPLRIELGGDLFYAFEEPPTGVGELVGLLVAAAVLLMAFGSLVAMGLPIGMALFGLALGVSSMGLVTYLFEIPGWAPELGSMVGLGVGIDYALFLVARHREHLAQGVAVPEAAGLAVATAGRVVVFAGGTVVIAILGLAVAGIPFITAGGIAIAAIVLIMVVASVSLLPALLGLAGPWVNRLGPPWRRRGDAAPAPWRRWGEHVCRHPLAYAVGATLVLLALAAPVLAMQVGNPDEGTLPESRTERRAYDLAASGFGPGVNGPLVIAVDVSRDPGAAGTVARAVRADRGIAGVAAPEVDAAAGVATVVAFPRTGPQAAATRSTIARLRGRVLPEALRGSAGRAHVGGQTASVLDVSGRVGERLPWFIAAVVLLSSLLLIAVFRSIVVPLKAALMNLLSIGAAYGVIVMVFQWGWGADLIGLESTVPIVSFIPMFMFAILFGLSMDYEVFLLSRVREEYLATGDNVEAVVRGIAGTARVITSAALIMIAVFLGFATGSDPAIKMFGLGLATAILIDATIVRMVLVPAAMTLLGDASWWLPRWLDRLLPAAGEEAELVTGPAVADGDGEGAEERVRVLA